MNPYCEQVKHNEKFYNAICANFSEAYYDWKITCIFYSAYHLLKALALHKNKDIGNRHKDILWSINPKNNNRPLQVKSDVFNAYDSLFNYSWTARYDGFLDYDDFQQLKKADHEHAQHLYNYFKNYCVSLGVSL